MTSASTTDPGTRRKRRARRRRLVVPLVAVVLVAAVAGVAYLVLRNDPAPDPHEANAERVAGAMLARFSPPDGATQVAETPGLDRLVDPDAPGLDQQVQRTKRWRLSGDAMSVAKEIAADPPAGYKVMSKTPMKTGSSIIYVWLRPEAKTTPTLHDQGIRERGLDLSVFDGDADTVELLANATVNWARTRSSDSKVPSDTTGLTIANAPADAVPPITSWDQPTTATERADVDRILAMVNSLDSGPESTANINCTSNPATAFGFYRLTFTTADGDESASAVVNTSGCNIVRLTVDGHDRGNFWGTKELSIALHDLHDEGS